MNVSHDFISLHDAGLRIKIKARPGARMATSAHRAIKVVTVGEGRHALEIPVAAPAAKGKANHALIELLADGLGLSKAAISIRAGTSGRLKLIEISGPPRELHQRVLAWIANADIPMTATNPKRVTSKR